MGQNTSGALLTPSHRSWLLEDEPPANKYDARSAIYSRLRAAIETDAGALADAIESGELNSDPVVKDFSFQELGDGIANLVAALYLLGDAKDAFDPEAAIKSGVQRGKEGYIASLEEKIEREGVNELTLSEMLDLRDAKPEEYWDRANLGIDQRMSDRHMGMGELDEIVDDLTEGDGG